MNGFDASRRFDPRRVRRRRARAHEEARLLKFVLVYVAALVAMLAPDAVWLTLAGPRLYRPALGDMLAETFRPAPAIVFYLVYVVGLTVLSEAPSIAVSTARGALFGLCAYGTYDLTNQATLRQWPTYLTVADLAWGTLLSAFAAFIAAVVRSRLA
jgi:uncharacterized membrane protein